MNDVKELSQQELDVLTKPEMNLIDRTNLWMDSIPVVGKLNTPTMKIILKIISALGAILLVVLYFLGKFDHPYLVIFAVLISLLDIAGIVHAYYLYKTSDE